MAVTECFGCFLIIFGPCLCIFTVFVLHDSFKVIIFILSAFFWLISLLLASFVWFAIVPFRDYSVIGVVVGVIFQELLRFILYLVIRKAEIGFQKMAVFDVLASGGQPPYLRLFSSFADENVIERRRVNYNLNATLQQDSIFPQKQNQFYMLDPRSLSYVTGLGFGLAFGTFISINLLRELAGPGTFGLRGEPASQSLVVSCQISVLMLLHILYGVISFYSLHSSNQLNFIVVVAIHMFLAVLTICNQLAATFSIINLVLSLCALVFCASWAFHMASGDIRKAKLLFSVKNQQ